MMNDSRKDRDHVRAAIDDCLSGVDQMPSLRLDIIQKARGEVKMKKKLSVGFVLVMILVLVTVAALAAVTWSALYEKAIEKEGQSGLIQDWSASDKVALVDWMVEAGAKLDETKVAQLHDGSLNEEQQGVLAMQLIQDYFPARDGILTSVDIIAKEKGPIEYWSLEDKAWFSEMLLKYQPEDVESVSLLPDANDITQDEAVGIMYAYYKETYGLEKEDFDESKMSISFSEETWNNGSGDERIQTWGLSVWLKNDTEHPMSIHILPNGEVKQASGPYVESWRDEWNDEYASIWTIEGMVAMQKEWKPKAEEILSSGDTLYNNMAYLLTVNFATPEDEATQEEPARKTADVAAVTALKISEEYLQTYYVARQAYIIDDYGKGMYFYWYVGSEASRTLPDAEKDNFQQLAVYVDGTTGEVEKVFPTNGKPLNQIL